MLSPPNRKECEAMFSDRISLLNRTDREAMFSDCISIVNSGTGYDTLP